MFAFLKKVLAGLGNRGEVIAPAPGTAAAPAAIAPGSASAIVPPAGVEVIPPGAPAPGAFEIPAAYKDKPYLKGIDSADKLYAMLDGAQVLIGKKGPSLPTADAPVTEWDAYYEAIGRPKEAKAYVLPGADKTDPLVLSGLQGAMHKHGFTQKQAEGFWVDAEAVLVDAMKQKGIAAEQQNVDFTKLATDTFGVNRDKVLAQGKELINANMSPSMKPHLDKLPNESLVLLADVLNNLSKKYIKPDGPGHPPALNGSTPDDMRAKARGLMVEQGKFSPTSVEFGNLQRQIDAIYDELRRAGVKL